MTSVAQILIFEEAGPDNIVEFMDVSARAYREHYFYLWTDGGEHYIKENYNRKSLLRELRDVHSRAWLLRLEGKPIGILKLNINRDILEYPDGIELERVYILKDFVGQGIGARIIDFVIAYARKRGRKFLWLKAMDQINPVEFYRRRGFETIGRTKLELPYIRKKYKDMVLMGLNL